MDLQTAIIRGKKAVKAGSNAQRDLGYIALELEPVEDKTLPGTLLILSNEICIRAGTLNKYRRVASKYKKSEWNQEVSWELHELFHMEDDCAELVKQEWLTFESAESELAKRKHDRAQAALAKSRAIAGHRQGTGTTQQRNSPFAAPDVQATPPATTTEEPGSQPEPIMDVLLEKDSKEHQESPAQQRKRAETTIKESLPRPTRKQENPESHWVHRHVITVLAALKTINDRKDAVWAITDDEINRLEDYIQKIRAAKDKSESKVA